jgi:Na+/melibiose symporter-like transporter
MRGAPAERGRLTAGRLAAYSALIVPMSMLHAPALSSLPGLYAKHAGIGLSAMGVALTLSRMFDVVIDPLIGFASDRTRTPLGRRKPWIAAGALISMLGVYFWFRPGPGEGVGYFLGWSLVVYLGWTLVEIPHAAWFSEFATGYDDRSRASTWRAGAGYLGALAFMAAPLLPIFPTHELTPKVTAFVAWAIIAAIPIGAAAALLLVPGGKAATTASEPASLMEMGRALATNAPLRFLAAAYGLSMLASGMTGAMYFFYIDAYLHILNKIAYVGVTVGLLSLASTPLWTPVIARIGKHRAAAVTLFSTAATLLAMALIRPGPSAFPALLGVFGVSAVLATGSQITLMTLMADVVDYDQWKTGANKAGAFFAVAALFTKVGYAVGGGAAFVIAGLFGFQPRGANNALGLAGFFLAFIGVPLALNLTAAVAALNFPITRRVQRALRRRLDRRAIAAALEAARS